MFDFHRRVPGFQGMIVFASNRSAEIAPLLLMPRVG
jgi:hypothetical protein